MGAKNAVKMLVNVPLLGSFLVLKRDCEQGISAMPGTDLAMHIVN